MIEITHMVPRRRKNTPGYPEAIRAVKFLAARWPAAPRVGIVLGSGLGEAMPDLSKARRVEWSSIPGCPQPSVAGHSGGLHLGFWCDVPVAVLAGRVHLYEGYEAGEVVFPVRVLALAGIHCLITTCAAGGIAPRATPGSFMVFSDHLNFQGANPLAGFHDPCWGQRFVDMGQAYDSGLRLHALKSARALGLRCFAGVYAALLGPSYETPAEIRVLKALGAGAVGMSTVQEVIAARQMGVRVLSVATITNRAAGLSRMPLSHEEVMTTGQAAARDLARLISAILPAEARIP